MLEALRTGDHDARGGAADLIVRAYRAPVLAALAWKWHLEPADADDLVQDFFATAFEKRWLERFDPDRARFRTFLRMAADRFAANAKQSAGRLKRGGGATTQSLDLLDLAGSDGDTDAEARFRDAWVRSIFGLSRDALREEALASDREVHWVLFESYDLTDHPDDARPTYARLGVQHGLTDTQVINHLAWARRRFRHHVLRVVRQLAGSDTEYREDVRELLGIDPP